MRRTIAKILIACSVLGSPALIAQVRQTKEQILFYTSEWKGERFPDGRPKVADDLLQRALNVSIEDIWDFLRGQGYVNQLTPDSRLFIPTSPSPDGRYGSIHAAPARYG